MKTKAALILGFSSALALSTASAEPFNARGVDFLAAVSTGSLVSHKEEIKAMPRSFQQRGENYVAAAPAGSDKSRQPAAISLNGFNGRSDW